MSSYLQSSPFHIPFISHKWDILKCPELCVCTCVHVCLYWWCNVTSLKPRTLFDNKWVQKAYRCCIDQVRLLLSRSSEIGEKRKKSWMRLQNWINLQKLPEAIFPWKQKEFKVQIQKLYFILYFGSSVLYDTLFPIM